MFEQADIDHIIKTPLSVKHNDAWYCRKEFWGCYIVRNGYKALTELDAPMDDFNVWNKLWKINVVPKICNFLWHCVKGVIPVRCALRGRKIQVEPECPLCGSVKETISHLVLDYNIVKKVLGTVGAASIFTSQHFNPWLDNLLNSTESSACS